MHRMFPRQLLAFVLLAVIASASATAAPAAKSGAKAAPAKAPAAKPAAWHPVVPFIEDDFGRALALAKERKLPVFIEGWAPW